MLVKGSFEKAKYYIESRSRDSEKGKPKIQGPCVTISRETGTGANLVSEYLTDYFTKYKSPHDSDWAVFDKNLIEKVLADHNLPERLSKIMEENKYAGFSSIIRELLGGQPGTWTLVHKTTQTILQLAKMGNVIIVGRGANVVTSKLENSFHVRLVGNMEDRIKHIEKYYNLNRQASIDFIKKDDIARKNYLAAYFHKEIDDPHLYHLVLNTSLLGHETTAKIIGRSVIKKYPESFTHNKTVLTAS